MGRRGPPKTPTAILDRRSSWRAKVRHDEPEAVGSPHPPDWLTDAERDVWDRLLPRLESMSVVGAVDSESLAVYVSIFARWRECEDFIAKHGMVMSVKNSEGKEYPQVARSGRLADQLIKLGQQYGMTASARAGLAVDTRSSKELDGIAGKINPRLVQP